MTQETALSPPSVMVGSVSEVEQHVTLPDVVTTTRSRALRAPCWALVLLSQVLGSGGPLWAFLGLS